jgi:hypothetical protein
VGLLDEARERLKKSAGNAWRWAKSPKKPGTRARRWKALWKVAKKKAKKAKDGIAWGVRKRIYRKHYLQQKQRAEQGQDPEFQPYMANGYPYSGLNDRLTSAIAWGVSFGLYTTSTKRDWGTTSWHEVWKAIDMAGSHDAMVRFQNWLAENRGGALEIFGPAAFYIKNGKRIGTAFPDHGDHDHYADS